MDIILVSGGVHRIGMVACFISEICKRKISRPQMDCFEPFTKALCREAGAFSSVENLYTIADPITHMETVAPIWSPKNTAQQHGTWENRVAVHHLNTSFPGIQDFPRFPRPASHVSHAMATKYQTRISGLSLTEPTCVPKPQASLRKSDCKSVGESSESISARKLRAICRYAGGGDTTIQHGHPFSDHANRA